MDLLTILGTLASVLGAAISIWQASRSRAAAREAERVVKQLATNTKTSELSSLQTLCKKALDSMKKYGRGIDSASLWGASSDRDAEDVQSFIIHVEEHRDHFNGAATNEADEFCQLVRPLLDTFNQATSNEDRCNQGAQLITHLSTFSAKIKHRLDTNRMIVSV